MLRYMQIKLAEKKHIMIETYDKNSTKLLRDDIQ